MQEVISAGPGISLILGGWLGYLIDPDLDALQRTYTEGRVHRYLGRRVGKLWQAIWAPYAVLIDHRSFWSHMPGIGTVLRASWLTAVAFLPLLLFHLFALAVLDISLLELLLDLLPDTLAHLHPQPQWGLWLLAGWTIQDFVHLALDGFNLH
jgi:uncharacterized metal-binding protein